MTLFPEWAQEAYWDLIDTQRACRIIATPLKRATQVRLDKPTGGYRPLTMLEESLKAIEGPPSRRRAQQRSQWPIGTIYFDSNLAGELHIRATLEVLAIDTMVCEDSILHNRPLSRSPTDYEKFFNIIQTPVCEAVEQCMGLPCGASELVAEVFSDLSITIETRWGDTEPLTPNRGIVQGSVSGPEEAKPAQSPILGLRELSEACYVTAHGCKVRAAGFVDDTQHYGSGGRHLLDIMKELSLGSIATGIGFAWNKFTAYASDWDDVFTTIGFPFSPEGINVSGWDIWKGIVKESFVPRSFADTPEKLLGKRGTILDRHSLADANTLAKIVVLRGRIGSLHASWDEAATMWQLIARGIIGYVTIVGTPSAASLHSEDSAFFRLVLSRLGARASLERVSLTAPRNIGGLQLASIVEYAVASVASEALYLLNGLTLASQLARDSLRFAMNEDPGSLTASTGLICRALTFLAGYGIYVTVATDKLVGRMLDALASKHKDIGHPLIGRFMMQDFARAQKYCRFGKIANTIRFAIAKLTSGGVPKRNWTATRTWKQALPGAGFLDARQCRDAYLEATSQSSLDYTTECFIFGRSPININEDWGDGAWVDPSAPDLDKRAQNLDSPVPTPDCELGLFGDGGYDIVRGASFSAEARPFQNNPSYFTSSLSPVGKVASRLPIRFGYEKASVHTAELSAMIASLRWADPTKWNLFVGDRSALFDSLREASSASSKWPNKGSSIPLEGRLKILMTRICKPRETAPPITKWRQDQVDRPEAWDVKISLVDGDTPRWFSKIAFVKESMVGVDIKSHQVNTAIPYPVIKEGNDAQDTNCLAIAASPLPPDIRLPSGGPFAFLCREGHMVTRVPHDFVRKLLRSQSTREMSLRPAQGRLAQLKEAIYPHSLDIRMFTSCPIPPRFDGLLLQSDQAASVDLSSILFRMHRSVGGGWTEYIKSDPSLLQLATRHHACLHLPSVRTCPFCRLQHGTPRHYVMECPETYLYALETCDAVEAALSDLGFPEELREAGLEHHAKYPSPFPFDFPDSSVSRWPILTAWKWLARNPLRENIFRSPSEGLPAATQEGAFDLAYCHAYHFNRRSRLGVKGQALSSSTTFGGPCRQVRMLCCVSKLRPLSPSGQRTQKS